MKKFYTVLATALFATASFAQPFGGLGTTAKPNGFLSQKHHGKLSAKAHKTAMTLSGSQAVPSLALAKAAAEDSPMITEQPEGTLFANYYGQETSLVEFWGMIYEDHIDGDAKNFVVADDGSVYLQSALSAYPSETWIKGTRAEGDTIVFNFPQKYVTLSEIDDEGEPTGEEESYYLYRMLLTEEGNSFRVDDQKQTLRYVMRNDSLFRVETIDDGVALGLCDEDNRWLGYSDLTCTWEKVTDRLVELPEGCTTETYQFNFFNSDGQEDSRLVYVYDADDAVYISGLTDNTRDKFVKGVKEGDKVVFRGKTYLGVNPDVDYHTFFAPVQYVEVEDPEYDDIIEELDFIDELAVDYDAETKSLYSDGMVAVTAGKNYVNTIAEFDGIDIKPWKNIASAPKDPEIVDFMAYDEEYGYGGMQIYLEHTSVDGYMLDPSKLFLNLFFDGEPFVFDPAIYTGLEAATTDLPVNFVNGETLTSYGNCRIMYFYVPVTSTVAVQEVYKDNGQEYRSRYVSYDIDEDGYITDGVQNATCNKDVESVSYADLSGRSIAQPTSGIYLKTVKYADGSQKTIKFLKK